MATGVIDEAAVRERLLAAHEPTLSAVVDAAAAVAADPAVTRAVDAPEADAVGGPEAPAADDDDAHGADDDDAHGADDDDAHGADGEDAAADDGPRAGGVDGDVGVADALETALVERSVLDDAPALLATAVEGAGRDLPATPVPAPPYVVVTSTGLVCRATLPDGRLLLRVEPFEPRRRPLRYVRTATTPAAALSVAFVE